MSPRENQCQPRLRLGLVDIDFLGLTISHVTLSCSQYVYTVYFLIFHSPAMMKSPYERNILDQTLNKQNTRNSLIDWLALNMLFSIPWKHYFICYARNNPPQDVWYLCLQTLNLIYLWHKKKSNLLQILKIYISMNSPVIWLKYCRYGLKHQPISTRHKIS